MNKITKNLAKYLIELIIVSFGVFLGVYFSNTSADNKIENDKDKVLEIIISELENNQKSLEYHIDYHTEIGVQLDSITKTLSQEVLMKDFTDRRKSILKDIKGWDGFKYARLETTAFEGAKLSGILKEYDIELIQKISRIYVAHETYDELGKTILNKAFEINTSSKIFDLIGTINLMTTDLLDYEIIVNNEIKKTIVELTKTREG